MNGYLSMTGTTQNSSLTKFSLFPLFSLMINRFIMTFITRIEVTTTCKFNGNNIKLRLIMYASRLLIDDFSFYLRHVLGSLPLKIGVNNKPITKPIKAGNAQANPMSAKGNGTALKKPGSPAATNPSCTETIAVNKIVT